MPGFEDGHVLVVCDVLGAEGHFEVVSFGEDLHLVIVVGRHDVAADSGVDDVVGFVPGME